MPTDTDLWGRYAHIKKRSARAIAFIEGECKVPQGRGRGKLYKLRPWQKRLLRRTLDHDGTVVWSGPRGLGKTGLTAPLLVFFLFDEEGAQVISASTSMRTARLAYDRAVVIIEASPELAAQVQIHRNTADPFVELPGRGSFMSPLPAQEQFIVGMSPTFIVLDEFGYVTPAVWEVLKTSLGKVEHALCIAIGTPGVGIMGTDEQPNVMWELRRRCFGDEPPPGVWYIEFAASHSDDPGDPKTWKKANPGLGDLVNIADVASDYATLPLSRFKQMRLGLWVQHETAWILVDDWDALEVIAGPPAPGTRLSLGFDGSVSGDGTGLWGYEHANARMVELGYWEPPAHAPRSWRVPRKEVMERIRWAFATFDVDLMLMDPFGWQSELQELVDEYGEDRVQALVTGATGRMSQPTDHFYASVVKREICTDGSQTLRSHVLSAIAKVRPTGPVIAKDARHPKRIDAAVSAILARWAGHIVGPWERRYGAW